MIDVKVGDWVVNSTDGNYFYKSKVLTVAHGHIKLHDYWQYIHSKQVIKQSLDAESSNFDIGEFKTLVKVPQNFVFDGILEKMPEEFI